MFKQIKKKIKNIYKKIIIEIFLIIYQKPKLLKKNQKDKSQNKFNIKIQGNGYSIYHFPKGVIYTDSNDTTAYISDNKYLSDASMQYYKFDNINSFNNKITKNETLKYGTPKIKKKINGNVLSLLSGGASKDNFTHWLTDIIPRIKIYNEKFNLKKIDKFFVPSLKYNFQLESLNLLGIKKNKIITSDKYKHIYAKNIYATSHPCYHLPMKVKKWSLEFLQKKYQVKILKDKYKKIFIERDQSYLLDKNDLEKSKNYRVLLNEFEIKKFLSSKGFKIIKPEKYSFLEQVKIFSSAHTVVGLYGAAMMMISFCKKNTKVLEIKPLLGGNEFKNISKILKLNHKQINLKPIFKSSTPQNGLLRCPIKKIKKELYL